MKSIESTKVTVSLFSEKFNDNVKLVNNKKAAPLNIKGMSFLKKCRDTMKVRKLTNPSSCSSWAEQTRGRGGGPIEDHWVTASAQDDMKTRLCIKHRGKDMSY